MNGTRALTWVMVLALLLPLAGCIFGRKSNPLSEFGRRRGERITVTVENQNFYDATIYAIGEGSGRSRLGSVPGNSSQGFELQGSPRSVSFEIRLQAGRPFTTYAIAVNPGDAVHLTVRSDVRLSILRR